MPSSVIFSLYEDRRANCWVGTRHGVGVSFADGTSAIIHELKTQDNEQISNFSVRNIIEDNDGSIWLATQHYATIQIVGDVTYLTPLVAVYL